MAIQRPAPRRVALVNAHLMARQMARQMAGLVGDLAIATETRERQRCRSGEQFTRLWQSSTLPPAAIP